VLIKIFTTAVRLTVATTILVVAAEANTLSSSAATPTDTVEVSPVSLAETTPVITVREFQKTVQGRAISAESNSEGTAVPNSSTASESAASNPVFTDAAKLRGATDGLSIAQSDPVEASHRKAQGFYITTSGAVSFRQRSGETADTFTDFKTGFAVNGAVGYRFGDFRTDVEFTHFNHPVEAVSAAPTGRRPGDGKVAGNAFMLNLYYDIPISNSRFKPYIGAGVGTYSTRIKNLTNDTLNSFGLVVENERSNNVFAFQLRAGLGYQVSDSANLFLGYRYFSGNTITFTDTIFGTLKPSGAKLHNIEAGVRFLF
jgi:opacity protein-like surface antigen